MGKIFEILHFSGEKFSVDIEMHISMHTYAHLRIYLLRILVCGHYCYYGF